LDRTEVLEASGADAQRRRKLPQHQRVLRLLVVVGQLDAKSAGVHLGVQAELDLARALRLEVRVAHATERHSGDVLATVDGSGDGQEEAQGVVRARLDTRVTPGATKPQ